MSIYVYGSNAQDLDCMGLVGELTPSECVHIEVAGGASELKMVHPLDEMGRWKALGVGCILKAPVPVRTTPEIANGQVVTTLEKWSVKPTATKAERYLYTKATGGRKKKLLKPATAITVVRKGETRYKAKTRYGYGWIAHAAIDQQVVETTAADTGAIEAVEPAWTVRDQLFRIYSMDKSDDGVTVNARHISYDLLGNLTSYKPADDNTPPSAREALEGVLAGCMEPHEFEAFTDMADTRVIEGWERVNPLKAMLDPEEGILAKWGCELVRDDYELYFLRRAGLNRGVRVEFGKNLLGVSCTVSYDNLVTRILPVGETKNGKPLYLEGSQTVDSERLGDYPTPHMMELKVDNAKVGKGVTAALARQRMQEAAQKMLDDGCDLPEVNLKVDFINLGDTEEYSQYKRLEDVYLYDTVRVRHERLGIEVNSNVVRTEFDCLRGRYRKVELGSLEGTVSQVATWQIPAGISGGKLIPGSVGSGQLAGDSIAADHLQANSVVAGTIAAGAVTAGTIDAGAITTQEISAAIGDIADARIGQATIDVAQIAQLSAEIASIAQAEIGSAVIDTAQIANLSAFVAAIAVAKIGEATIETAQINELAAVVSSIAQAEIGSADIDWAHIKDLVTDTAIITQGVGGKLYINRLAVTEANVASLTVGELLVKGSDGKFYALGVDGDGNVTTTERPVGADNIANNTIPAGKIIENSITARELNVAEIFADSALVGAITAGNIAANAIQGQHISTNAVQALNGRLDLTANESINTIVGNIQVGGTNLIRGTADYTGWSLTGTGAADYVTVLGDGGPTDQDSELRVMVSGAADNILCGMASPYVPVLPGSKLTLSCWARRIRPDIADYQGYSVQVSYFGADGAGLGASNAVTDWASLPVDEWIQHSVTSTVPAGATIARVYLRLRRNGLVYFWHPQLEAGTKATDWAPAPADADDRIDGAYSRISQLSDKISLVVAEGSTSSGVTITPTALAAIAANIDLTGKVTFASLDSGTQGKINTAQSTATAAQSAAATAQSTANDTKATVDGWKYNNTTTIDGGKVATGTLEANVLSTDALTALGNTLNMGANQSIQAIVGGIQVGGAQLLRDAKALTVGSTADTWRTTGAGARIMTYTNGTIRQMELAASGLTADGWYDISSPVAALPTIWRGRTVVLSTWVWSTNWAAVDQGIAWSVCLSKGGTAALNYKTNYYIVVPGQATLGSQGHTDGTFGNNRWVRVWTTITLDEANFDGAGTFADNTHIFVRFYLRRNGDYRMRMPKLEFGTRPTDWEVSPDEMISAALSIDPVNGLKVTQSALSTYFQANAQRFGLYNSSDNKAFAEVGVSGGKGYLAVNRLGTPDRSVQFKADLGTFTDADGTWHGMVFSDWNDNPIGSMYGHGAPGYDEAILLIRGGDAINYGRVAICGSHVRVYATGGDTNADPGFQVVGWSEYDGRLVPAQTATYRLGSEAKRWGTLMTSNSPNVSSDIRIKRDIAPIDRPEALIYALEPVQYRMIAEPDAKPSWGFVAQQVAEALSATQQESAVVDDSYPDSWGLVYEQLIAPLVATVQTQHRQIDALEQRLAYLERLLGVQQPE